MDASVLLPTSIFCLRPAGESAINTRHGSNMLKIERNGAGRHRSRLHDQTNGEAISPQLVIHRCNDARSEALKHFFSSRDVEDFYFADVLNCFIALAQYPLNFAVFVQGAQGGPTVFAETRPDDLFHGRDVRCAHLCIEPHNPCIR